MLPSGISFHYISPAFYFPQRNRLKNFLQQLIRKEGQTLEHLNYVFCDDAYLYEMNQKYLNHDTYTDIITFPFSKKGYPLLADIYISVDRVKDNAQNLDTRFIQELHRVIFHGALHLCGYKDRTQKEVAEMRKKEDSYLNQYFRST